MKTNHSVDTILGQRAAADSSSYSDLTCPPRNRQRRCRTAFSESALSRLEDAFDQQPYPDILMRERLADEVGLSEARIQVWFQNRRSRLRRRQGISKSRVVKKLSGSPTTSPASSPPPAVQTSPPVQASTSPITHSTPNHVPIRTTIPSLGLSPIVTNPTDMYGLSRVYAYPAINGVYPHVLPYQFAPMFTDVHPTMPHVPHWSPTTASRYAPFFQFPPFPTTSLNDSGTNEDEQTKPIDLRSPQQQWATRRGRPSPTSFDTGRGSVSPPAPSYCDPNSNEEILDVVT